MKRKVLRSVLIIGILAAAVGLTMFMSRMKPPPQIREATEVVPLVEIIPLEQTEVAFRIDTQGTVRPRTETVLSAEVSGPIVRISPKFVAGGVFQKGEELLRIDPTNYRVAVEQAEALLKQRQIEYEGAEKLRLKGYRAEADLASAAAALATARAELTRARRDLERTRITLPYAGMVRSKEADIGQYVNPGSRLGVTFATDYAEVRLPLTDQDLAFVDLPDPADIGDDAAARGPAVVLSAEREGRLVEWEARIVRTEGVVDETNRLTYAVARVQDPYALKDEHAGRVPLPMGTFVSAKVDGVSVDNVVRVPRRALRGNNQLLFVDEESRLQIRPVDIIRADADFAYLRGESLAGRRITLTALESPINGMRVRTEAEAAEAAGDKERLAAGGEP
ncbi:MAG: efflux RND transporter periplasmic adaptor subunit [Gammaproteobacteria bacterium]